jgi:hypothetical protein
LGIYVVRVAGGFALAALVCAVNRILAVARPAMDVRIRWAATAVAVLNPMVLAMSMTIQNDTLALALTAWLVVVVLEGDGRWSVRRAVILGLIAGFAVLAKLSVLPAVAVALLWALIRRGRDGASSVVTSAAVAIAVTAWWFARNAELYGDPSARAGVSRTGVEFPPLGVHPDVVIHLVRAAVTYLWLPVEYYRNTIHSPLPIDAFIVVVTFASLAVGGWSLRRRLDSSTSLLFVIATVSLGSWVGTAVLEQAVAFRVAYASLLAYAMLVALAIERIGRVGHRGTVVASALAVGSVLGLHLWTILAVASVAYPSGLWLG